MSIQLNSADHLSRKLWFFLETEKNRQYCEVDKEEETFSFETDSDYFHLSFDDIEGLYNLVQLIKQTNKIS